ncbi:unnamed protein product [Symbiodinium sp. CCMP2456]|nr:unnamed protein product [Symbiodinium sp. CCMP2456]
MLHSASSSRVLTARVQSIYQLRCTSNAWQISSCGRVRTSTGAIHFGSLMQSGYRQVLIAKHPYLVHRVVAATFFGPPPDPSRWQVNHIDGDRSNNHVSNLQYVSASENVRHSWAKRSRKVLWRPFGNTSWSQSASQSEASALLGVASQKVSLCCTGLRTKALGRGIWYEFKLESEQADEECLASQRQVWLSDERWHVAKYPCESDPIPNLLVSNHGRISPIKRGRGGMTRGTLARNGYYVVNRLGRSLLVHRLVAGTFLDQPLSPDMQVNHIDLDRGNNHVENLEYVTPAQNIKHGYRHRAKGGTPIWKGKAVQARTRGYAGLWQDFVSIKSAAAMTGISPRCISRACAGAPHNLAEWDFRFVKEEPLPGEEWRAVVLEGARAPKGSSSELPEVPGH